MNIFTTNSCSLGEVCNFIFVGNFCGEYHDDLIIILYNFIRVWIFVLMYGWPIVILSSGRRGFTSLSVVPLYTMYIIQEFTASLYDMLFL